MPGKREQPVIEGVFNIYSFAFCMSASTPLSTYYSEKLYVHSSKFKSGLYTFA